MLGTSATVPVKAKNRHTFIWVVMLTEIWQTWKKMLSLFLYWKSYTHIVAYCLWTLDSLWEVLWQPRNVDMWPSTCKKTANWPGDANFIETVTYRLGNEESHLLVHNTMVSSNSDSRIEAGVTKKSMLLAHFWWPLSCTLPVLWILNSRAKALVKFRNYMILECQ